MKSTGINCFIRIGKGRKGGGVAIYVRDTINSYVNNFVRASDNSESVCVEVILGKDKLLLGNVYRAPNLSSEATGSLL